MHETRSDTLLLAHVVWATKHRAPLLAAHHDLHLRGLLIGSVRSLGAEPIAFGAYDDHVHVLVRVPANAPVTASPARHGEPSHGEGLPRG